VPGGLRYQLDPDTVCLFHFDEEDGVQPSDAAGNVVDLKPPGGMSAPLRVDGIVGMAREWATGRGLAGRELVPDATRLRRSMTIEALVYLTGDGLRTICQRGDGASAGETVLFGLRVSTVGNVGTVTMFWDGGSVPSATFVLAPDRWVNLAAVRRWSTEDLIEVDYYADGEPIGTVTATGGSVGDGENGTLTIGVAP
jgi:hypothetical protein